MKRKTIVRLLRLLELVLLVILPLCGLMWIRQYFNGRRESYGWSDAIGWGRREERDRPQTGPPFDQGYVVISALKAYRAKHKRFPSSWRDLVPDYLSAMPPPGWGANEWHYESDETGSSFRLSVQRYSDTAIGSWSYFSQGEAGAWYYDNS